MQSCRRFWIRRFKWVRQHGSVARRDLVDVAVRVGEETFDCGTAVAEADQDVDPGWIDCGAHGIAARTRDEVDIPSS